MTGSEFIRNTPSRGDNIWTVTHTEVKFGDTDYNFTLLRPKTVVNKKVVYSSTNYFNTYTTHEVELETKGVEPVYDQRLDVNDLEICDDIHDKIYHKYVGYGNKSKFFTEEKAYAGLTKEINDYLKYLNNRIAKYSKLKDKKFKKIVDELILEKENFITENNLKNE